ncbi:MAG: CDP-alcohol phosphatidyltransferase family protein [Candidatus Heimdallarchaeota archaeon]|nr:CDP-alcohol phosphatidyltransferase family protein [Candidatus Heimdallarchaeota archaeon]
MGKWRNFKLKTRSSYKKYMQPFGRLIGKTGISPNAITMISGVFAIATAVMYSFQGNVGTFKHWWAIGFVLMFLTGFIDVVDGSVARATGKTTKFGKVLDPVMDRFAEFCFLIGIAIGKFTYEPLTWSFLDDIPIGAICMFSFAGMIFASYSRARGESVAQMTVESVGIMERREKLIVLYLGNLLYFWFPIALPVAILFIGLLSFITTIQRMFFIRKMMKELGDAEISDENSITVEKSNIEEETKNKIA